MGERSFGVALRETREKIIETLNTSGLPIDAMDMLLGEIRAVVHGQAEQEYMIEMQKQKEETSEEEQK